jgi:hypothetical protein
MNRVRLGAAVAIVGAVAAVMWVSPNAYRVRAVLRHGWVWWRPVAIDSPALSPSMRLALQGPPITTPGSFAWRTLAPGFDVGELPVLAAGREVDRIMLARIDPAKYRFQLRTSPGGDRSLAGWMAQTRAVLIVNGSYYGHDGRPATPVRSSGKLLGPSVYDAHGGAFVASDGFTGIRSLASTPWASALLTANDGLVSYPMLIEPGGTNGVKQSSRWLANRSFVGQDSSGHIVLGTTKDAFFSLYALARFLRAAPLDLTTALNLDGGPVACQGIAIGTYQRRTVGKWEFQANASDAHLLSWLYGDTFAMPIVLAVFPR